MRKPFIISLFVFATLFCKGQNPFSYSTIIREDSLSAEQLYEATKNWFAHTFRDSKSVLENENPGKELIGKGSVSIIFNGLSFKGLTGNINYTIDIQFRDGRLKLDLTNFTHTGQLVGYKYNTSMGIVLDSLPNDLKELGGNFNNLQFRTNYKRFHKDAIIVCKKTAIHISENLALFIRNNRIKEEEEW